MNFGKAFMNISSKIKNKERNDVAKFLVTGGAGFIGSNLVGALLEENHEVRVLDNFSTGKRENLSEFLKDVELIEGDIRDIETCYKATKQVDYVLHQAALGSVPRSVKDPLTTHESNVNGTLNMLIAARDNDVNRVVLAASSSAYGDTKVLPKVETMKPSPLSPYAVSKLVLEYYAEVFYKVYGLETVSLRYFNVFGPKQDPESQYAAVIPKFVKVLLNHERPTIYGDGEQTRDFTYIDNVVDANLKACFSTSEACGKVFNIACNERITLNQLYGILCRLLEVDIEPIYDAPRPGDVKHSLADIQQAINYLGYKPQVFVEEGLQRSIQWYRENLA